MYMVSMWSFQHGFLDYVNRNELNQLEGLSIALQKEYAQKNSWNGLKNQPWVWRKFISAHVLHPARLNESTLMRVPEEDISPNPQILKHPGRLLLLDEHQHVISGNPRFKEHAIFRPLMHNNRIIGYLGIEKRAELSETLDQVFSRQQQLNFVWIALGSLLITVLIALPFSSQLIKPIKELLAGTLSITEGNYQHRVQVNSKDEIGMLSKAFNEMASNIEQHQKVQQQWMADISHELRTPLAVIKAEIEAMLDGIRSIDKNSIESLSQEIDYLNRLVNDLHELSKSDTHALQPKKSSFILLDAIKETLEIFDTEIQQKKFQLTNNVPENISIIADKEQLIQVLINLLQNNLRYTVEGGELLINANVLKNNGSSIVKLTWEDSGPGVENKNLEKLFDRLYREDKSRSSFSKGSGLGLSISKSIIENHSGSIKAFHSTLGGLGIEITLPRGS